MVGHVGPALVTQVLALLHDFSAPLLEVLRVVIRGPDTHTWTYLRLPLPKRAGHVLKVLPSSAA